MNNENNLSSEDHDTNENNNSEFLLKYILSTALNIIIIICFITYRLKNNLPENFLSNRKYKCVKMNRKIKNRYLEDINGLFSDSEEQIAIRTKNGIIDDEIKKYLSIILENFNGLESIKDIINGKIYIVSKDSYFIEQQKELFLSRLSGKTYSGTWEYFPYYQDDKKNISKLENIYFLNSTNKKFKIGSSYIGSVNFNFQKAVEAATREKALGLSMINLEGDYKDNWINHISYAMLKNLDKIIDKENKKYIVKGEFITTLSKGKLFYNIKKKSKKFQCGTYIEMEFPLTEVTLQKQFYDKTIIARNISTIIPSNLTMILSSSCGFRMKIKADIFNEEKLYYDIKKKVIYYSYYSIISSIIYLIGSSFLTFSLKRNESAISCICLESFSQNVAWHSYCAITNINFGLMNSRFFLYFCVIAVLPLINFIIFDLRFLYFFWKIKKRVVNERNFTILRLKFFIIFYGLLILGFFSGSSFFINKLYIIILSITLWTPQIIHNIVYYNKYIYPTFFILSTTLDRMLYPFYFRGIKNNFLFLKEDKFLIIFVCLYILLTIIILYLQIFLGPRFMLSVKYQKKYSEFYKNKQELLEERPDCLKEECVICISPLLDEYTKNKYKGKYNENSDIKINSNENENKSNIITNGYKENINRSFNSRFDLINNTMKPNLNNNHNDINGIENKKIIKNRQHLGKKRNNNILIINARKKEMKKHKRRTNKFSIKNIEKIIKIILFENMFKFYKLKLNLGNKKYMVIACGHMFHSNCVEKWFDRKKECPNCRASMEDYL